MKKKYILAIVITLFIAALLVTVYNASNMHAGIGNSIRAAVSGGADLRVSQITFEAGARAASDVVIAQYVGRRPFGQALTEFEFIVHERIFGNAPDRVFVYVDDRFIEATGSRDRPFSANGHYLLFLDKRADVYANTHKDGYTFRANLTLDVNNPTSGTMHDDPLTQHSLGMNFNSRSLTRDAIISYVSALPRHDFPTRVYIRSDNLEDIINGSPNVLIVEVNEPRRLSNEQISSDWMSTDIYYTTVVEVLKGDKQVGDRVRVVFFAGTVSIGQRHIVSITPSSPTNPDPYFFRFTSRNSLHTMSQLGQIMQILDFCPDYAAYRAWREAVRQAEAEYRAWREWLHAIGQCEYPCAICAHEAYLAWRAWLHAIGQCEPDCAICAYIAWREAIRQAEAAYRAYREWLHQTGQCVHPCMFCD